MGIEAFAMTLKPGFADEYKKRHDEIWPELEKAIRDAGIYDYHIFLDEKTNTLFAFHKTREKESAAELGELPIVRKWWDYMADIMEVNPDNSPKTAPLRQVFRME